MTFEYFNNLSSSYINDLFNPAGQHTTNIRTSLLKLDQPLQKKKQSQTKKIIPMWDQLSEINYWIS